MPETEESVAVPDESSENYVYPDEDGSVVDVAEPETPEERQEPQVPEESSPEETEETQEPAQDSPQNEPELSDEEVRAEYARLRSEVGRNGQQLGEARKVLLAQGFTFDEKGLPVPPAQPVSQTPATPEAPPALPERYDPRHNPYEGQVDEQGWPLDKYGRSFYEDATAFGTDPDTGEATPEAERAYASWFSRYSTETVALEMDAREQFNEAKRQQREREEAVRQQVTAEEQAITNLLTTKVFTAVPEAEREAAVTAHRNEALSLVQRMGGNPSDPLALRVGTALLLLHALEQADEQAVLQTSAKPAPVQSPNRPATAKLAPKTPPPVDGGTGSVPVGAGASNGRKAAADDDAAYKADTFSYED